MTCKYVKCSKDFQPRRPWQSFCTKVCRYNHHNYMRSALHASTRILGGSATALVLIIPSFLIS